MEDGRVESCDILVRMVIAMLLFAFPFECCFCLRRCKMVYDMSQEMVNKIHLTLILLGGIRCQSL